MFKQIFLLDLVLIFCVLALASAQSARFVEAKYRSFNSSNLNTSGVLCAAQDGNKSFSWPSKYGLTAFCGPVGPVGKAACGKCLDVSYDNPSPKIFLTELVERVRIVDNCSSGGLELDIDVFKRFDTSGYGMSQGYLVVDYEFVDCGSSHSNWKGNLIIGGVSAAVSVFLIYFILYFFGCKLSIWQGKFQFRTKNDTNIEAFLKDHGALLQKRYKYSELKKMTDSFKVKLGQGGFGVVYKGKLLNGCDVAIKILNSSKGNGEEFINEVSSKKKALIYEFMSNGSLDKFIYNKGPERITSLSWDNLYQIAKGIARGLEYLHRGCTTRILHFDIKPHNILLDENLCPKISDFGLAKLCPKKESIISMTDQRGTMGYVAPEVWNRHFGGVSHKSDVYSYGMMLLEMVGGRKNIIADASHTSEIYFPHWVYNRLELGTNLRPDGVMDTEEDEIARRMTIVGLWCIQTFPSDRPTMSKVIEMLEVNMNLLEIPPKPYLSSPTRSISESFKS
ncbi:putative glycerophosphodiester phosphodiesterase, protein kinase RLK-Pelle-LRK10L-2 family [Medicago truncatula]|uniref:Putative glycerophosphodiester phosphodiesterase, protein kinase RLK-Pelle-LRK10L-2 family n=1 Tax=Medicago truncatula TaxID=3880 RepID=A0A396HHN8_MEDTR|nr:putative glycerophosphodiester phosphodiesterase, protein kinase RLK-Pelle-LRK10L-2 family [Medicago truncatula]